MGKKEDNYYNEHNRNDGYYEFQGGFISYNPATLTEYYMVRGFEGNAKKKEKSESYWS